MSTDITQGKVASFFSFLFWCDDLGNTKEYGPSPADAIRTLLPNLIVACQASNTVENPAISL